MGSGIKTKQLRIGGMTCMSCQNKIEKKLRNTAGVKNVIVSYSAGTADIAYDADIITLKELSAVIEKLDYKVLTGNEKEVPKTGRIIGILIIIIALYVILQQFGILNLLVPSQLAETGMSYGMLFVIGLITSVHCVAMCGGINLSQCIPKPAVDTGKSSRFATLRPTILYNFGRVISYTAIGFVVGALGSAVTFSNTLQGVLKLLAGVFMVIMGINMLGIFPWLRKLNPGMPRFLANKINTGKHCSKSPLIVGLLNGLMPCGPLQAMQIYALSTGNPFAGALSMFLFSMGTVPLMFGLGALSSALGKKFTQKVMTVGAILVAVLGLTMFTQGWNLSGIVLPSTGGAVNSQTSTASDVTVENGKQIIKSTLSSGKYPNITVLAGTPVKWIIDAPKGSINGCNNRVLIKPFNIEYTFKTGENTIEFTPAKAGKYQYSCWMGMIRGSITVTETGSNSSSSTEGNAVNDSAQSSPTDPVPAGYIIPTDNIIIAKKAVDKYGDNIQEVTVQLTDQGFSPAVIVVQSGLETKWNIVNSAAQSANRSNLSVPFYSTQVPLQTGENSLYFNPTKSFDFSTGDNAFYGYVKVVEDLNQVDIEAVKNEVKAFKTMIWPPETFQDSSQGTTGGASCH